MVASEFFESRAVFIGDAAFGAAIGFLAGVLVASLGWSLAEVAGWVIFVAIVSAVLRIFPDFTEFIVSAPLTARIGIPAIYLTAFFLGTFYFPWFLGSQAARMKLPVATAVNKPIVFSAIISDEPKTSSKYVLLTVDLERPYAGTLTVFAPSESDYHYGDELQVEGAVSQAKAGTPQNTPGENPAVFPRHLKLVASHKGFWLREALINLKLAIIDRYNGVLPSDEAMLLGGITFGAKQNFKIELKNAMAASGTTHLVAISGYNITIIVIAAEELLGVLLARRAKFFATVALMVLFVLMTGLQSSAIRAAIMGFLALAAKESGRVFSMRNGIALTAAAMVALQPTVLVYDVGFELSFLSLLGIVCLCDPLKKAAQKIFRYEDSGVFEWKESAVTTLSAQLGTMPVLIAVFNQFSATAIFANVLVLGTVPLTMLLGFVIAVLGFVAPYLAWFVAKAAWLLLAYQLGVIRFFAALAVPLPFAFNSAATFAVYYAALGWFAYEMR